MTKVREDRIRELEQRVKEFHDVGLDEVLEVIDYLRDEDDSVLVGGSLAYGLGNRESDLDIVVAGPATDESSSRMPLEHFVESLRVDVWRLHQNEIDELFERAQRCLADERPLLGVFGHVFEQADLKLLHRVAYGVVLDGPELFPSTRDYREVARDLLVREYAERMRHSLFVAQLALRAGRTLAAAMSARFGVEDALQAVMAWRGLPFSDNKWLRLRLELDVPDLEDLYRPLAVLPEGEEAVARYVAEAIATAEALLGLSLDAGVLIANAAWEAEGLKVYRAGDLQLLLAAGQDVAFELGAGEITAWEDLGEAPWPCVGCTDLQSQLCFALYAQGVARLRWERGVPLAELTLGREG